MPNKTCSKCNKEKGREKFCKDSRLKSGLSSSCKQCKSEYDLQPHRKAKRDKYDKSPEGLLSHNKAKKKWVANNAIKKYALDSVSKAVKDGDLIKSECCEECGATGRIEGHHSDYAEPLMVSWLCSKCHRSWHMINGEAENAHDIPVMAAACAN